MVLGLIKAAHTAYKVAKAVKKAKKAKKAIDAAKSKKSPIDYATKKKPSKSMATRNKDGAYDSNEKYVERRARAHLDKGTKPDPKDHFGRTGSTFIELRMEEMSKPNVSRLVKDFAKKKKTSSMPMATRKKATKTKK